MLIHQRIQKSKTQSYNKSHKNKSTAKLIRLQNVNKLLYCWEAILKLWSFSLDFIVLLFCSYSYLKIVILFKYSFNLFKF